MCNAIDINSLPGKAGPFGNLGLACDIVIAPWISDNSRVNGFRLVFSNHRIGIELDLRYYY